LLLDEIVGRMRSARFVLFAAIGGFGVVTQLVFLRLALDAFGIAFFAAQAMAALAAMTGNFLLNNIVTYRDRRLCGAAVVRGLFGFYAVCALGAAANVVVASHLFAGGLRWWLAGIVGAIVAAAWNYAMSSALVWRTNIGPPAALPLAPARARINPAPARATAVADATD
jgi:dolichol-phosphate mannosyltransferase